MNDQFYSEITVVIVLYEEKYELIDRCLENIKDFNIIIIDNAGNKKLRDQIKRKYTILDYILNSKNLGYSKAVNQGINLSESKYIFVFQADCVMDEENIKELMNAHKKYDNCFIVSPTYYDFNSKLSYNGGTLPEKKLGNMTLQLEGDICVNTIVTAAYLFKKKDMVDIDFFDENFFIYYLDFDICRKAKKQNKSIIQVYNSKAQHAHGNLKVKNLFKKIYLKNYYFTFDELYYYYKINKHHEILEKLKNKIPNFLIKAIFNILILRIDKVVLYISKILAFYKFKNFLKKTKI